MLTSTGQALDERIEIIGDDPRMRLAGGPEVVLDAEMQLHVTSAKPHTAARRENRWLVYPCHVEDIDKERASCGLLTARHRQLHMMQAVEHKISSEGDEDTGPVRSNLLATPQCHNGEGWNQSARVSDALALIDLDGTLVDRDRRFVLWARGFRR
jgi:hypothetical protein